jgi:hypothetical protein
LTSNTSTWLDSLDSSLSDVGGKTQYATTPWKGCPDCAPYDYCDLHQCNAMSTKSGHRCNGIADPARGYEVCRSHGCRYEYPNTTIKCMNHSQRQGWCPEHMPPRILATA